MPRPTLWIDVGTPKYAMFFSVMIPELEKRGYTVVVTTRYSPEYREAKEILDLHGIPCYKLGAYGGSTLRDKFVARINRQLEIVELFDEIGTPALLITGAVVDGVQAAFGLGIPVVNIYDTPAVFFPQDPMDSHSFTPVARLTLPYSTLFFYPFVLEKSCFDNLGLPPERMIPYNFIDVCLWMDRIIHDTANDFRTRYGLDTAKPTIMIREEEYKAHYVKEKIPLIYELIPMLHARFDANLIIMPRYEHDYLKRDFGHIATVLEEKLKPEQFYPFIDLFIGGGGTMNLESVYYGIPTISTRSIWLFHDRYLLQHGLMHWTDNAEEALRLAGELLGTRVDAKSHFCKGECGFDGIIAQIETLL